jgi:hypothetical protein
MSIGGTTMVVTPPFSETTFGLMKFGDVSVLLGFPAMEFKSGSWLCLSRRCTAERNCAISAVAFAFHLAESAHGSKKL